MRRPSASAVPYHVFQGDSALVALQRGLEPGQRRDLVGAAGGLETTSYLLRESGRLSEAELHDASDDYHFVLAGSAVYTLGGSLDSPREVGSGEWRSQSGTGGRSFEVKAGDMLFVPRGTLHRRDTRGRDLTLMVVKIYEDPVATPR